MARYCLTLIIILLSSLAWSPVNGQVPVVKQLPLSTRSAHELAPIVNDSVLYFISNRKTNLLATYMDQNNELLYRLFSVRINANHTFGVPRDFSLSGQTLINNGPLTFSPNGTSLIITQNKPDNRNPKKGGSRLGLFKSEKRRNEWGFPRPLKFAERSNFSIAHPSLSSDGQLLYFVSDMKGGFGETDLYVSKKSPKGWGTPENLGPGINTPGKELFPYVHPSGLLFFTSNGHGEQKDMNIYYINRMLINSKPTPLPSPINSEYDDFSCFIFEDTGHGFFSSNREGQDDLYEFTTPRSDLNLRPVKDDNFCYTFFENGPDESDSLPKIYRWSFGDGEYALGLEADHCYKAPGNYTILLNVVDTLTNEELFSVATYNLELKETRQIWFAPPDTLKTGESFKLEATLKGFQEQVVPPVFYWDSGDGIHHIGETLSHIYQKEGKYRIICSAQLEEIGEICFYREVTVID